MFEELENEDGDFVRPITVVDFKDGSGASIYFNDTPVTNVIVAQGMTPDQIQTGI